MISPMETVFSSNRAIAERLLKSLVDSRAAASNHPIEIAHAIGIGIRAAHLLGIEHIKSVSHDLPPSIQALMDLPEANMDPERDAFIESREYIGFIELIDILSTQESECVAPHLHRGWQDKVQSCREARKTAHKVVGNVIVTNQRESLLLASATYNRVFLVPAPVQLIPAKVRTALASIIGLIERLAIPPVESSELTSLLNSLKKQV